MQSPTLRMRQFYTNEWAFWFIVSWGRPSSYTPHHRFSATDSAVSPTNPVLFSSSPSGSIKLLLILKERPMRKRSGGVLLFGASQLGSLGRRAHGKRKHMFISSPGKHLSPFSHPATLFWEWPAFQWHFSHKLPVCSSQWLRNPVTPMNPKPQSSGKAG